jgi:hypothetical protein
MAKNKPEFTLHKIEELNPYDYEREAKNKKTGEPIILSDGSTLKFIDTLAKWTWMLMVYPEAVMDKPEVTITPLNDYARLIEAKVAVYRRPSDEKPAGAAYYPITCWDEAVLDEQLRYAVKTAKAMALTDAISSEAELFMNAMPEGEMPVDMTPTSQETTSEEKEKKRRGRPRKEVKTEETEDVQASVSAMLAAAEEKANVAKSEATEEPEEKVESAEKEDAEVKAKIAEAKATVLAVKDENKAKPALIPYIGKTLGEIMDEFPDFCHLVTVRPAIKNDVVDEVIKAATFIDSHTTK